MHSMASQRSLVCLVVICLLCGACAAAKRRYLSVSMDELLGSSKAHLDCPPRKKSVTTSGNRLTVPASCGLPPKCCGTDRDRSFHRHVLNHDMNRLSTLLQRPSVSSSAAAPAPSVDPIPWFNPFAPAPSPSFPPVAPPAEAPAVSIPDSPGTSLDTLEYVVTVGFGTPAKPYTLIFDTGSDVSWIQCQPCSGHCYKQHDPIFDPTKSTTYSAVPCGDQCTAAGGKCGNGTCLYKVEYGDGSSTAGVLSHETLSLTSTQALHGFAFGCGQTNLGDFGDVDGLIGLGRGALSLPSQAAATFGGTFSYCLPSDNTTNGYLTIGATTPASNHEPQYTAMIHKEAYPSFYFVGLVSIDIGGYILPVNATVFTRDGTLLDSGTILTYLPPEAYTLLRDRFKFTMTQYKPAPEYDPFDTCYDFTGQGAIIIPAVTFKFSDGSVFDLDFYGILIFPDDTAPATGCLAFVPKPSSMPFSIVGNTQQRNTEVIYDVAAEKIGFVPASC